jgi:hypothetical protein
MGTENTIRFGSLIDQCIGKSIKGHDNFDLGKAYGL